MIILSVLACESLVSITIHESKEVSESDSFYDYQSRDNSNPKVVKSIGERAFSGCGKLVNFIIPQGITEIGDWALANCKSLTNFAFPKGLKSIVGGFLKGCESLVRVIVPEGVEFLNFSFRDSPSLGEIVFPKSLKEIYLFVIPSDTLLLVSLDSYAHQWAIRNNIKFEVAE